MENFFMLPKSIFEAVNKAKLSMSERWILLTLMKFADNELGYCFASNKTIAETAGVSKITVKRALPALEKKKFIQVEPFFKNSKDYGRGGTVVVNGTTYHDIKRVISVPHLEPKLTTGGQNDTQYQIDTRGWYQNDTRGWYQNDTSPRYQIDTTSNTKKTKTKNTNTKSKVSKGSKSDKPTSEPLDDRLAQKAMEIAQEKGVDDPVAYHYGILKNWQKKGIKTWNDYEKAEKTRTNSSHRNSRGHKPYEEKLPDWAKKKGKEKSKKKAENADKSATVNQDISRLMERLNDKTKSGEKNN